MTKPLTFKLLQMTLPLLGAAMLLAMPGKAEAADYPITTTVTSGLSTGTLVCTSNSVSEGGSVTCTAIPASGYVFEDEVGFGGCDQPGDVINGPYSDTCQMNNVTGPRSLTANFVPFMTPPTNIDALPDGQGNLIVSWTPPTENGGHPIRDYTIWVAPWPYTGSGLLGNVCPGTATSCPVAGYQAGQAYGIGITVFNEAGAGDGHFAYSEEMLQVATLGLPGGGGDATVRWHGPKVDRTLEPPPPTCLLSSPPSFAALSPEDLQSQGAPLGATAPLGALQFQANGCGPEEATTVVIDYPAGILSGLQAYKYGPPEAEAAPAWFAYGTISGNRVTYSLVNNGVGDGDSDEAAIKDPFAPLAVPAPSYSIGGSITGLTGNGLMLRNNGGDDLSVAAQATSFTFATTLVQGSTYAVTVQNQPEGQACTVTNGTGTASGNVTDVSINCQASGPGTGGVQAVPTLGQWGLLLLIAMAGLLGWRMRRPQ